MGDAVDKLALKLTAAGLGITAGATAGIGHASGQHKQPTKQPAARPSHGTGQVIKVRGYTRSGVPVKAHERGGPKSADPQAPKDPRLLPFTLPFEVPEPSTVRGWQKLWDQVPDSEWGGADVSYSVQMPDGRRVWLYGDTFSGRNGFVHSTAITQSGGRLHVSNKGKQLLPDEKPKGTRQTIYWITDAKAVGRNKLKIFATPTSVGKAGPWDFRQVGNKSRVAMATVDRRGNVNFDRWNGYVPIHRTSYDRGQDMKVDPKNPRHFTYARTVHPIKLANGKKLVTVCQNWDDPLENHRNADGSFRYRDFRPYFTQE